MPNAIAISIRGLREASMIVHDRHRRIGPLAGRRNKPRANPFANTTIDARKFLGLR